MFFYSHKEVITSRSPAIPFRESLRDGNSERNNNVDKTIKLNGYKRGDSLWKQH